MKRNGGYLSAPSSVTWDDGFTAGTGNSVTCSKNGGFCISPKCPPGMKQIGTCGLPGSKCCRK
uniref:Beta/alpha-defensin C-terminal domain-containing protein n=1 Tax=Equus asinus TaxID=9793 RepID=A0A9L0JD48_EQUAS